MLISKIRHRTRKHYDAAPVQAMFFLAWQNLIYKRLRTSLTVVGIAVGIGAIFFLLSISLGLQNLVTNQLVGGESIKTIDVSSAKSDIVTLDNKAAARIRQLPNIEQLGIAFAAPSVLKYQGSESTGPVYGIDIDYHEISDVHISSGRGFTSDDKDSVILSTSKLRSIGVKNPKDILDKTISLNIPLKATADTPAKTVQAELTVIGIVESESENIVFVPDHIFVEAGQTKYSQIKLIARNLEDISTLRRQIESIGFEVSSPADTLEQVNQIFSYFNVVLISFGAIGMIVAVLGMFNTLTISLLERTKEIGLMFALGGRRRDMRRIFILEAVLLSIMGSILGIAIAILLGQIANFFLNQLAQERGVAESFQLFATPLWLVLLLTVFMIFVGLAVVFFPARRAESIDPIEALRRE